ncbi:helix-turn-helix domain-containing protein [Sporosarcina sp. SAFN-015]|uniref:helix-turn-helix domain-containing protein n=1 Tax=Sporosarcina sp. SAFN-015 TaxID=3387274 RepID=UPI003F819C33
MVRILEVELVQSDLDAGMSVSAIGRKYGVHHETVRRFIKRNSFEDYVAFDEIEYHAIPPVLLADCFHIDSPYKVVPNEPVCEYVMRNFNVDMPGITSLADDYRSDLEREALSQFVADHSPDDLNNAALTEYRHIVHYIYKHYGGFDNFRAYHNISVPLVEYTSSLNRSYFARMGHRFESMLHKSFQVIGSPVSTTYYQDGCLPDFVLEDEWLDAKLSKSTAFNRGCKTIEKYTRHTDYLTLIYAIDDMPDDDIPDLPEGVRLVHVFDYFPDISPGLRDEIQTLIDEVSARKGRTVKTA